MMTQCAKDTNKQLFREFVVVIPHKDIEAHLEEMLSQKAKKISLPGFRPGKAPLSLVRKKYESDLLPDVLDRLIDQTSSQLLEKHKVRPALRPHVHLDAPYKPGQDVSYTMHFEALPELPSINISELALETYRIKDDPKKLIDLNARQSKLVGGFSSITTPRPSKIGDQTIIDFVGTVDGVALPGGSANDFTLELGAKQFIDGFEEGLVGHSQGDVVTLNLQFPDPYHDKKLSGKSVQFVVTIKEIKELASAPLDDDLAQQLGFKSLEELQTSNKKRIQSSKETLERRYAKQVILDTLDQKYDFDVPQTLVEMEFNSICHQLAQEVSEKEQEEYREKNRDLWIKDFKPIANRRVRLGLVLAHLGVENKIEISQNELIEAVMEEARDYPDQTTQVIDYYKNNPDAVSRLRASLLEEKSIDFILKNAKIQEKEISEEDLIALQDKKLASL